MMKKADSELVVVMVVAIAIVLAAILSGCSALSLRPVERNHALRKAEVTQKLGVDEETVNAAVAADQAECDALDNKVTGFTATTVVLAILSGGSGLTSVFTDNTPRYAIGGVGVGLAAGSGLFTYLSTQFAQRYSRRCAVNLGGR